MKRSLAAALLWIGFPATATPSLAQPPAAAAQRPCVPRPLLRGPLVSGPEADVAPARRARDAVFKLCVCDSTGSLRTRRQWWDACVRRSMRCGTGTAFFVNPAGYALTAEHVVPVHADRRLVVFAVDAGPTTEVTVLGADPALDVAVLRVVPHLIEPLSMPAAVVESSDGERRRAVVVVAVAESHVLLATRAGTPRIRRAWLTRGDFAIRARVVVDASAAGWVVVDALGRSGKAGSRSPASVPYLEVAAAAPLHPGAALRAVALAGEAGIVTHRVAVARKDPAGLRLAGGSALCDGQSAAARLAEQRGARTRCLVLDRALWRGSSGGPLLDGNGRVVAMLSFRLEERGDAEHIESMLLRGRTRSARVAVTAGSLGRPDGLGGGAGGCPLSSGIALHFGPTMEALRYELRRLAGAEVELGVAVAEVGIPAQAPAATRTVGESSRRATPWPANDGRRSGVQVVNTAGHRGPLRVGDVIVALAGRPVASKEDVAEALANRTAWDAVHVRLLRDNKPASVLMRPVERSCPHVGGPANRGDR